MAKGIAKGQASAGASRLDSSIGAQEESVEDSV
jgi:hypothetical protein